jgi:hypothetical protein
MYTFKKEPMTTNAQVHEEVNKVYKTSDLSIFKTISGNRVVNPQHVKRICDSITINGMLCNPILVNEKLEVIDGQHRLNACKKANSHIYYIILNNYDLSQVHTLNLNQKNWTKKDFLEGYANMGIKSYVDFKDFLEKNEDFSLPICMAFCNNTTDNSHNKLGENLEVFEDGSWKGRDFNIGQDWANKIRIIQPYYKGYNTGVFVGTLITLFKNENFDFNEFMHKLRLQPTALLDCRNREQYKTLIEDIYNWRSRNKVNLRY